jgi:penicillin amidase
MMPTSPVESIMQTDTVQSSSLSAPVDLVRDEWGIPHIYGANFPDVAFAEGYVMGQDRLVQMDLARHQADGTLTELFGVSIPSLLDSDVSIRAHHLRATATTAFMQLQASSDPTDKLIAAALTSFAAGVNAYLADLRSGKFSLPGQLAFLYDPSTTKPWTEVDSLLLGAYELFLLSFDADSEIFHSQLDADAKMTFDDSMDPQLQLRKGIGDDLQILAPVDPTHTISGWTGMNGDMTTASLAPKIDAGMIALYAADRPSVYGLGHDRLTHPEIGSNNWIIGPQMTQNGHTIVANDTHLQLSNPPVFYLVHVKNGGDRPVDAMGVQLAGAPGIALGMNEHVAWGGTVNNIDVTDVYRETVVACDNSQMPCVMFNGMKVPLVPRQEAFNIGSFGKVKSTINLTLYDVPQHGPIIPRVVNHNALDPLGSTELSIKFTGHEPSKILNAFYGVFTAKTMQEAVASFDKDFKFGGQNWVIGDDQGNFGWTQVIRVPRRAATAVPWKVLPGDGTAEWGPDMDPKYIPHAYNPSQGFLATANADPIGVTDDNEPFFTEPMVDGAPLYLGAYYDPGTRVGRVTKRVMNATGGGNKATLDNMGEIQADAIWEYGEMLAPTFLDAGKALAEEIANPGTHPELTTIATGASSDVKALVSQLNGVVAMWSFDTPSGAAEDNPAPNVLTDSRASTIVNVWLKELVSAALDDEEGKLTAGRDGEADLKLITFMCVHPDKLKTGLSQMTGDSILWDDLSTVEIESKRQIAALALSRAIDLTVKMLGNDPMKWTWGRLHTLTLDFPAPMDPLKIPLKTDPNFPTGFPRHGSLGTLDVGNYGSDPMDYSYDHGPAIRFSCELDPAGPKARNALPGGEIFDPGSPHYADQMALWRHNKTFDLAFSDGDVVKSAMTELSARGFGRVRFSP